MPHKKKKKFHVLFLIWKKSKVFFLFPLWSCGITSRLRNVWCILHKKGGIFNYIEKKIRGTHRSYHSVFPRAKLCSIFYIHISPHFEHQHKNFTQIIGMETNPMRCWPTAAKLTRTGFGSHVDGASKLLIDSALFLELREVGVSCSHGKVFVWSCVTQCKDPETPGAHL